jgi:regulation of enolase protein 1 (concanavalin A-like superfamily)
MMNKTLTKLTGSSLTLGMQSTKMALLALAAGTMLAGSANAAILFQDNFDVAHDYTGGVGATGWDGLLNSGITTFNSTTSNAGKLTMAGDSTWGGLSAMEAPFLYVNLTGDFVATTVIATATAANFSGAGMAAVDGANTDSFVTAHASFSSPRHMTWSTTNSSRAQTQVTASGGVGDLNYYQIERSGDTLISRYSDDSGDTWNTIVSVERTDLTDTLQVGVFQSSSSGNTNTAQFESFTVIPEPSNLALIVSGFGVLMAVGRRRGRK